MRAAIGNSAILTACVCAALLQLPPSPVRAGNVLVQVACGNPPQLDQTKHDARLVGLVRGEVEDRGELLLPVDARVSEIWIDKRRLTLKSSAIKRGFVETEELGKIFVFFSESRGNPGYFVAILPEQLEQLGPLSGR